MVQKVAVSVGKLAIASCILKAENESNLQIKSEAVESWSRTGPGNGKKYQHSWAYDLFVMLSSGLDFSDFLDVLKGITFVTFNYDRCIENVFYTACEKLFPEGKDTAEPLSACLDIVHVYCSLGQINNVSDVLHGFGDASPTNIYSASQRLKTFGEGAVSETHSAVNARISSAKNVVFLGYGFLDLNNELLFSNGPEIKKT